MSMLKNIRCLIALCLLVFAACFGGAAQAAAEDGTAPLELHPVTLTDHGTTLTMTLPQVPDFESHEMPLPNGFYMNEFLSYRKDMDFRVHVQHMIYGHMNGGEPVEPQLEETAKGMRKNFRTLYKLDRFDRDETLDLDGTPARLLSFSFAMDGKRYTDDYLMVVFGQEEWSVSLTRPAGSVSVEQRMDEMLTSVRVTAAK